MTHEQIYGALVMLALMVIFLSIICLGGLAVTVFQNIRNGKKF